VEVLTERGGTAVKVRSILQEKGHEVITVAPDASVADAIRRLRRDRIGAVVVSVDGDRVDGIVTETDVVRGLADAGAEVLTRPVSGLMRDEVTTCAPEDEVRDLMADMTHRRSRYIVAVEDHRLVGIVSIGDVVKSQLEDRELEVRVLRDLAHARS
jgi:CBS domain-containing protein